MSHKLITLQKCDFKYCSEYFTWWWHSQNSLFQFYRFSNATLINSSDTEEVLHFLLQAADNIGGAGDGNFGALGPILCMFRMNLKDIARGIVSHFGGTPSQ